MKCSYQPIGALWQFKKGARKGIYAFNHFKASYGPANGCTGLPHFFFPQVSQRISNSQELFNSCFLQMTERMMQGLSFAASIHFPVFQMKRKIQTLYYDRRQARQYKDIHSEHLTCCIRKRKRGEI